ncbi:MAG: hypothetical protein M3N91_01180 [Pseudomonadota bacterium]|nr:hypothetical protein [Pseudomonadota bacterium]
MCTDRPQLAKIKILAGAGLAPKEIAEIVGTTPNTVSVSLSAMRRKAKPTAKKKKVVTNVVPTDAELLS